MKLTPLEPAGRGGIAGMPFGYSIINRQPKAGKNGSLCIVIGSDLVRAWKMRDGQAIRIDADVKAKYARLTPVAGLGRASRKLKVKASGRAEFRMPYSGDIVGAFPVPKGMTELAGAEVTSDGLLFRLP